MSKNLPKIKRKNVQMAPKISLIVCTSHKEVKEIEHKFNTQFVNPTDCHADGWMSYVTDKKQTHLVMYVKPQKCKAYMYSVIAHEAYHGAARYFEFIGDSKPSEESYAHAVGNITEQALKIILK